MHELYITSSLPGASAIARVLLSHRCRLPGLHDLQSGHSCQVPLALPFSERAIDALTEHVSLDALEVTAETVELCFDVLEVRAKLQLHCSARLAHVLHHQGIDRHKHGGADAKRPRPSLRSELTPFWLALDEGCGMPHAMLPHAPRFGACIGTEAAADHICLP